MAPAARAHLTWRAPAASGCIDRRELERRVEALLARDVFAPSASADNEIDGSIVYRDGRWIAVLSLATRAGQNVGVRELASEDAECAALNRALVVVLATLIDSPVPAPSGMDGPWRGFGVGVLTGVDTAVLSAAAPSAGALAMFAPARPWPALWLEILGWFPQVGRDAGGRGGRFLAFAANFSLCPALFEGGVMQLAACAGARFGVLQARGLGLDPAHTPGRLLVATYVEPAVSWRLFEHLSLRVSAGISIALERPEFYFHGADGARHPIYRGDLFGMFARVGFIADRF